MTKEQKFYKALQDVFIGAKIEGEGGFINLMRIKSSYYSQIEKLLKEDIDKALEKYPAFREELFDKLYSFFSRYFTESGSIYFNSTPFHNNIYEKVYTDEKDVILFWKTQMLYYVKTDRIFRSMPVEIDGLKFYFDASKIENKKANEKRALIFEIGKVREDGTIVFASAYSERGRITKQAEILKALKQKGIAITEEQLEKVFRVFEKQSEVDFFINKNARAFLQEQFKLWSYQYFWEGAREWASDRVNQLQILKGIAFKIIDFISQFEDELVKIWNKPKFVRNSNYVITLDRIKDKKLIGKILKAEGIKEQIKEWQELGIVDENFKIKDVFETDLTGKHLTKKYEHLPIDTKYFKEFELEILSLFDDLDNQLDGWLIKSENYQALNTILPKFKGEVQTIYIDPPFNLDSSDQFLYRTNYKDANWATLLENRLKLAKNVLNEKGSIFVRCDYNGNWLVRPIMDMIFSPSNYRNEIIVNRFKRQLNDLSKLNFATEFLYYYAKTEKSKINIVLKPRTCTFCGNLMNPKWRPMTSPGIRWSPIDEKYAKIIGNEYCRFEKGKYLTTARVVEGKIFLSPKGRHWTFNQEKIDELLRENRIRVSRNDLEYLQSEETPVDTTWTDLKGYEFGSEFSTENAEELLERVYSLTTKDQDLIMDFFLGSGTAVDVAQKMGRKWLGVEMGEHFYSVVLPRMKKVLAYDKSGISKEVKEYKGGGFFKYYELEQYEEALANCKYQDGDLFNSPSKTPYQEYVFMKDEKMLKALEIDYKNNKVKVDLIKLYPDIDIAETLSNLTGKWIKKIGDGEVWLDGMDKPIDIRNLDYKLIKPLIWWE
jgi:adenine specific DNA methylase Mod